MKIDENRWNRSRNGIETADLASKSWPRNHSEAFKVGSRLTFAAFTSLSLADSTAESFGDRILFQALDLSL